MPKDASRNAHKSRPDGSQRDPHPLAKSEEGLPFPLSFDISIGETERFSKLATRSRLSGAELARHAFVAGLEQMEEDIRLVDALREAASD
ncbi:hypothetical protein NVV95_03170 [Herbiconiux sp. CPCC 205716]|uniref:Uncharacterized protein n=1 Tax=Herbiconiux gentiana TaxID=2970912 RepID=A0ABT2GD41_9MICO|nr:hypothetical protein [Herbiconiux gentiana]MCS5713552.1 hypothetical protein [Herbiconiux gentiana]